MITRIKMELSVEVLPLAEPFRVSGYVFEHAEVVLVSLDDGTHVGRGEASGVFYLGDRAQSMIAAIEGARTPIEAGATRKDLLTLMPAGGGRNAVDSALWELQSRREAVPIWRLAGLDEPRPLVTTFTVGADEPTVMAAKALRYGDIKMLKVKLTGDLQLDIDRVRAIRAARPDLWIGVDGNQGFERGDLNPLMDALLDANVSLVEQPLRRGREADLDGYNSPIPLAADESILTLSDLPNVAGRFQVANVKLDKCGGLTSGLMIAKQARLLGMRVMVGNMIGTSLGMAPAFLLGQGCDIVDLDGPLFLAQDREPTVRYSRGAVWCGPEVWGDANSTDARTGLAREKEGL